LLLRVEPSACTFASSLLTCKQQDTKTNLNKEADMATTQTRNSTPSIDGVFERAGEAQEQFAAAARKAGNAYLDSYEKVVDRAIELELKLAGTTQQDWIKSIAETQADFTRELASTYTSTARTLLK
jgi:hypothetical protein